MITKGETAGLGAEITQQWFQDRFKERKVFNHQGIGGNNVSKTNNDPKDTKDDHEVDAISGATITRRWCYRYDQERLAHIYLILKDAC